VKMMISRLGHQPPLSPVWIAQASRSDNASLMARNMIDAPSGNLIVSCSGEPLGTPVKRRSRKEPRQRRKEEMLRHRDFVRPPVVGNAENLRMIAPGPDDRTGKLGGSSDQTGGPARDSDRPRVIGVEQIVTLEAPSGGESGASGGRGVFGRTDQGNREAGMVFGLFRWSGRSEDGFRIIRTERNRRVAWAFGPTQPSNPRNLAPLFGAARM